MSRRSSPPVVLLIAALAFIAGCAKKPVTAPAPPGAPHFPDYVFPAAPVGLATADLDYRHASAWQSLQAGDPKAADREFAAILKEAPAYYPSEAGLGYAALARHDNGAAIAHFDKALAASATYAPALVGKGDALLAQGHTDAALEAFEAALAADRSLTTLGARIDALKFRSAQDAVANARKRGRRGRFDEARGCMKARLRRHPTARPAPRARPRRTERPATPTRQSRRRSRPWRSIPATPGRSR